MAGAFSRLKVNLFIIAEKFLLGNATLRIEVEKASLTEITANHPFEERRKKAVRFNVYCIN
jgi:hypothetical protein